MKKRVCVALIALAIVAAVACFAAGCGSNDGAQAFEERFYMVTYVDGDQVIKEAKVKENTLAENLDISGAKKGYAFAFWAFNDTEFNFNESIRRNVRLTAKWVPIKYILTFYGHDNQKIAEVEYTVEDTDIDEPDVPEIEGYTGSWEEYAADGGNKDIRAVYEANTYTARFVVGDELLEEIQYKTGESIEEPPVPPREGCAGRWEEYELKGDITVHAIYELAPDPSRGGDTDTESENNEAQNQGGGEVVEPDGNESDSGEKVPDISQEPQNNDPSPDVNERNNKDKDDGETEPQTPPEESEDKDDIEGGQGEKESGQQEEKPEEKQPEDTPVNPPEEGNNNDTDPPEDKDKDGQEGSQDPVPQEPAEPRKPTEGLVFEEIDGGLMVAGYTGTDTEVYIPSEYNGSPVIEIGEYAFEESRVTTVEIADGLQLIGRYAFSSTLLTEVSLPDSVTEICDGAFWGCLNLKSLKLGAGLKKFGRNVIAGCPELTGVKFAEPTGWRVSSDKDGDQSDPVSPDLLSSPTSALDYLTENLKKYLLKG